MSIISFVTGYSKYVLNLAVVSTLLFISVLSANVAFAEMPDKYQFGVFPHMSLAHIERKYAPVAHAMSNLLNKTVRLGTATDIKKFQKRVLKGDFDVAMIPPLAIVPVVDEAGYIPLARRQSKAVSVVVLNDSEINNVENLKGKTVGLPAGTPVTIILHLTLEDKGLIENKSIYFKAFNNVQACLHYLVLKKVDACGTASGAAKNMFQDKVGVKIRSIMDTDPFPHMLLVANPKMSLIERKILSRAILGEDKSSQGKALVKALGIKSKFIRYKKEDYNNIRVFRQRWMKHAKHTL